MAWENLETETASPEPCCTLSQVFPLACCVHRREHLELRWFLLAPGADGLGYKKVFELFSGLQAEASM